MEEWRFVRARGRREKRKGMEEWRFLRAKGRRGRRKATTLEAEQCSAWPEKGFEEEEYREGQITVPRQVGPASRQASTILDLLNIRAFHNQRLLHYGHASALGFRIRSGVITSIPSILVFVHRKVHSHWVPPHLLVPPTIQGPNGIWCDLDVVEFSQFDPSASPDDDTASSPFLEGLRGQSQDIGPGSQICTATMYATIGPLVRSKIGEHEVGFLTNRQLAVETSSQWRAVFHPLSPPLGYGTYLGAIDRTSSFVYEEDWYVGYCGTNTDALVRVDGAFIPFAEGFDRSILTTHQKGVGELGDMHSVDLNDTMSTLVGKTVQKVGRSSGLTQGTLLGYAFEYNDGKGACYFSDFLIIGLENQHFHLQGDDGGLITILSEDGSKAIPLGLVWGGDNGGRLKTRLGHLPARWTLGVDLVRLLNLLDLDLITTHDVLQESFNEEDRQVMVGRVALSTTN